MCFSSGSGGMEYDALKLADKLSINTDVFLVCKKHSFIESIYNEGEHPFPCVRIAFSSRIFSISLLLGVRSFLSKYKVDNVIFFGASELKTLYFAFSGFKINLAVRHGTTKSRPKTDIFHRLIYSRVNYHIALSQHLLENVKEIVPDTACVVFKIIFPSFNIDSTKRVSRHSDSQLNIVHVGRVVGGKGQVDAVYACRSLREGNISFQFNMLGGLENAEYVSELEGQIKAEKFTDSAHILGHVSDVSNYLQSADIFLFPSAGEGMPNAFIEAMYHNVVCICYENTVFPEFSRMGFYIHIVDNGDREKLSEKLIEVAMNLENEKEKAAVNRNLVTKYFAIERELADWDEVLV